MLTRRTTGAGVTAWGAWLLGLMMAAATAPSLLAQQTFDLTPQGWTAEPVLVPDSPAGRLQTIRATLAESAEAEAAGDTRRSKKLAKAARKQATQWIKDHPRHALLPEAYLLRGDAWVGQRRYYKALFDYEFIAQAYPGSQAFQDALEREYRIAKLYVDGLKLRLLGMNILPGDGEGEELLIRVQERAPGSDVGERASLALADYYYSKPDFRLAATAYELFLTNYPNSVHREWATLRLIQASLGRFRGPRYDTTGLVEAIQRLSEYERDYPAAAQSIGTEALVLRIEESLALRDYNNAQWYRERGRPISAVAMYKRVVQDYPRTTAAEQALAQIEKLGYRLDDAIGQPITAGFENTP